MVKLRSHKEHKDKNKELWKRQILTAAAISFKQKGYKGTTMDDIAKQIDVTKAAIYYYFKNKEALALECNLISLDTMLEMIKTIDEKYQKPSDKISAAIFEYIKGMAGEPINSVVLLLDNELSPKAKRIVNQKRVKVDLWLRNVIAEGVNSGAFHSEDPKMLSYAILGAMNWTFRWYKPNGDQSPDEIGNIFSKYLIRGLIKEA